MVHDAQLLHIVLRGLAAFDPSAGFAGLTGDADVSYLSDADMARAEHLLETTPDHEIDAALASVEADIASAKRARRGS